MITLASIPNDPDILGAMTTSIAEYVRQRRLNRGFQTQAALAEAAGISSAHLNQIEKGKIAVPNADLRRKLAKALGVSHLDILIATGEIDAEEVRAIGVEGMVEEGPTYHLQEVLTRYDWKWEEAERLAAIIEAYAKPRDPSMTNQRDT